MAIAFLYFILALLIPATSLSMAPRPNLLVVPRLVMGMGMSSRNSIEPVMKRTMRSMDGAFAKSFKVVTDIDDTVKSSGGVKLLGIPLGGIDTQFKRGTFYPGAFQFAFELSSAMKKSVPENVAVLTARAREFKFALELKQGDKLCSAFRAVGQRNGEKEWGIGDVYYGSVVEWIFQERKGTRKLENFEIMLKTDQSSNRNCKYLFVGDTGEKDEEAGERIAKKFGSARLRAVFLHSVSDSVDRSLLRLPKDRSTNGVPIYYFRTYVGAANKAFRGNLLGREALLRVIDTASSELSVLEAKEKNKAMAPLTSQSAKVRAATRRTELEEDIAEAKWGLRRTGGSALAFLNPPRFDLFGPGRATQSGMMR